MVNIGQMMKQIQDMQSKMSDMQGRLGDVEATGSAGGGLVLATMNGHHVLKKIKIDPKAIDPAELDVLEDLVVVACNDAKNKIDAMIAQETDKMMGGLKLPAGFKLPF